MMLHSFYYHLSRFDFPTYAERQCYMHEIDVRRPRMPEGYEGYGAPVMNAIRRAGVKTGTVFMTVDEKIIEAGQSQRRPGPHVDGCFKKAPEIDSDLPEGHVPRGFRGGGYWGHQLSEFEDDREATVEDVRGKGPFKGMDDRTIDALLNGPYGFNGGGWGHGGGGGWNHSCNQVPFKRMPVIVASSVQGCKVYGGVFDAEPTDCGDLTHIQHELGEGFILPENQAWLLSPDCVHESMLFPVATMRQFIRLALPVDTAI